MRYRCRLEWRLARLTEYQAARLKDRLFGFKRKQVPELATVFDKNRMDQRASKRRDGSGPKLLCRDIRLHHAHLPWPRKPPPDLMGRLGADPASPVCAKNKELRHIPHRAATGYIRACW